MMIHKLAYIMMTSIGSCLHLHWFYFNSTMRRLFHEEVRSVYERLRSPADLLKLGRIYVRKKVAWLWLPIFYFLIPWVLIGLNYGFNVGVCSSSSARAYPSLDGLCSGTTLSQIDSLPWYLDLWDLDQQGPTTAHAGQDWPLYIEWFMSGSARLHNPTLAISHQLSKMVHRYPGPAAHDLVNRFRRCKHNLHLGTLIGVLILDRRP